MTILVIAVGVWLTAMTAAHARVVYTHRRYA